MKKEKKKRINFSVDKSAIEFLETVKEENGLNFNGDALSFLIEENKRLKEEKLSLDEISNTITNHLHVLLKEELHRIHSGTNNTDQNTQMILEMLNGWMDSESIVSIKTTKEQTSKPLIQAKEIVRERIENQRQKRIEWEENKGVNL